MIDRDIADTAVTVLVVVGVAALLVPALFPVQQVLYHDTDAGTAANGSELEARGYTVLEYENLSDRGQEIYVAALRSSAGEYTVPAGEGAPEFPYTAAEDFGEVRNETAFEQRRRLTSVVIERPDDAELPPPDEPVDRIGPEEQQAAADSTARPTRNQSRLEQRRQVVARYDLLTVRQGTPPVTDSGNLLRLGSVLFGTVVIGVGGYLRSRP